ncbi:unnamed protein product [Ceutorhynchus assimilis]|uniref:THUMP domain-containing protein n=1 Tax=Ceutorhynchus assimilis TaxID=467358 RepID=A0A9N9QR94_9CUCU|nr:unnamed protein product [Ceutorhynchus assimilis]
MSKARKPYSSRPYYNKPAPKRSNVEVNLKGFLCSCNNREKDCIRETYNLLNKYADILWPPEPAESTSAEAQGGIEEDLQKELQVLRAATPRRFQVVDSGAKNFLFIKTTVEDPVKLAEAIMSEIFEKKTQETKFLLRLVPVEVTCKAKVKEIEQAFQALCEKYFSTSAKSFSVIFNHRNNDSVSRDEVIKTIADNVLNQGTSNKLVHKVDLKNAEVSIVVEIIRGFAFLAVVPDFYKYKKYNLLAFIEPEAEARAEGDLNTVEETNVENKNDTN